jgi:hypothetical protein
LDPDTTKHHDRDEIGLVHSICVKERSSAKRKDLYKNVQVKAGVSHPTQLLLDMKVHWSSTYVMINRAESSRQHVDVFMYEMGLQERDLAKRAKIDYLRLTSAEWMRVGQFADLLSVCSLYTSHKSRSNLFLQYADVAQQAFSSDTGTTLHLAIPALETLHRAWSSRADRHKYIRFSPALRAAAQKLDEYYEKTTDSPAYIMAMCMQHPVL